MKIDGIAGKVASDLRIGVSGAKGLEPLTPCLQIAGIARVVRLELDG